MKKLLLLTTLSGLLALSGFAQTANYWSANEASRSNITKDKAVTRATFPAAFKLFSLNVEPLRQVLFAAVNTSQSSGRSAVISLPNAAGGMEDFEMFEASNFEPALQARFQEIRSFSGKGITDKTATLKLSMSPQGIQTMVFRTGKENEFIEPYSQDHSVYAVFTSQRATGSLSWTCSTPDEQMATNLNQQIGRSGIMARSGGDLKTMRLAQSVTAEYSNYFGATSASQVGLVLAAINATLTRCNGVYEKDLALHLNLVDASTNVIYYNPATDPYSPAAQLGNWNNQLQSTLTANIGEANYDIGHLFGATGGGGNAGCIGCVCTDGTKGRGYTSPADAIPQGDNFDIDYVVHEIGHQLGANHTFSYRNENTGVNKEIGSGITIMGYAGITAQDVAPHSIDIFHEASIAQIQANLANKTCPVTTVITNATPVVAAVSNYTIPRSTPFALTGAATDANASDVLTYCWEQNDNALTTQTGANSVASPTKLTGPNWLSFRPTTSPTRLFPQLATILAGAQVTGPLPGGDAGTNIEALSSVARVLNFRLTVRDNAPYRSTAPASVGQTAFTDMVVTVNAASGPFVVTVPNTAVTWAGGSSQTITWDVANTTAAPVSCANVKISLSTDGGQTFPTVLAASTPNDGTEVLTIPSTASTTARIKVEAVGNIFFDISNTNFTICTAPAKPVVTVSGPTIFNQGDNVTLTAPAGFASYLWSNGATTQSITVTDAGSYTVVVTNSSGCSSPASDPIIVTLYPNPVIFVTVSGAGNMSGLNWLNAISNSQIQSKMTSAVSGSQFWVKGGTYYPTEYPNGCSNCNTDRDNAFLLKNGIAVYGGFAGNEFLLEQRNIPVNPTILSGNIGNVNSTADNSYHVVISISNDTTAILDGFGILSGNAGGYGTRSMMGQNVGQSSGAGIYNNQSAPSILNCTISQNSSSSSGAGMLNLSSSPVITNCTIMLNSSSYDGGGMANGYGSSPLITNTRFISNSAAGNGGGIYNNAIITINGGLFQQNSSYAGGGIANYSANATITGTAFERNSSGYGGGVYNIYSSNIAITNAVFVSNSSNSGGAIYNNSSSPKIVNSTFYTTATNGSRTLYNSNSYPTITNSIIRSSSGSGAGIDNQNSNTNITYSLVQGGWGGTGNSSADPLFVDATNPAGADGVLGTADDGLKVQAASPAINAGSNAAVPANTTTDITGAARIQGGTVDMGAYESGVISPVITQTTPFNCDPVNSAYVIGFKNGTNCTVAPFSVYVTNLAGTLSTGPLFSTADSVEVNGIGINATDGKGYCLYYRRDNTTTPNSCINDTVKLVRFGANGVVETLGYIPQPAGYIINTSLGTVDAGGNYLFGALINGQLAVGRIANTQLLTTGTGPLPAAYRTVAYNCGGRIFGDWAINPSDPLKLYTYGIYINASNQVAGTVVTIDLATTPNAVLSCVAATETTGVFFDAAQDNFGGIMFGNDGNMYGVNHNTRRYYRINPNTGAITLISTVPANGSGTPTTSPMRADLASCTSAIATAPGFVQLSVTPAGNTRATVSWEAGGARPGDVFDVERSYDGYSFVTLATEKAKVSSINSVTTDTRTGITNYYRVKQTSATGSVTYSPVHKFLTTSTSKNKMMLYENLVTGSVVKGELSIYKTGNVVFTILNAAGTKVFSRSAVMNAGTSGFSHPIPSLAKGVYLLQAVIDNERLNQKFVVQ